MKKNKSIKIDNGTAEDRQIDVIQISSRLLDYREKYFDTGMAFLRIEIARDGIETSCESGCFDTFDEAIDFYQNVITELNIIKELKMIKSLLKENK